MKQTKIITLAFFIIYSIAAVILINMSLQSQTLLNNASSFNAIIESYNQLQKSTAIVNLVSYFVLLIVSFWAFATNKKLTYVFLSIILYIAVTLFNSVSLNKSFFVLKGTNPMDETGYWIMLFMGIFYIIGAIVMAVIGFIAIRNFTKRR